MKEYLKKLREPGQRVNLLFPFLGVKVERLEPDKVVLCLPWREDFLQGAGVVAGGVMATLADEAMAHVVLINLEPGESTATIEMNIRYLRTIEKGELRAVATVVKKGRKILTVAADILDEKDRLLAQAGASFMVVEKKS